jgi:hypothetical protein
MASGNFLIGVDLSIKAFDLYVAPILDRNGLAVSDWLKIYPENRSSKILVSIIGKGDLEKTVNETLLESREFIKTEEEKRRKATFQERFAYIAHETQVSEFSHKEKVKKEEVFVYRGIYEKIGIYNLDNTASELFPSIAQGYLLNALKIKANEIVHQIKELTQKRLKDL